MPSHEYIESVDKYFRKRKMVLNKAQEKQIKEAYERAYKDTLGKYLEQKGRTGESAQVIAREAYVNQIYDETQKIIKQFGGEMNQLMARTQTDMLLCEFEYQDTPLYKAVMKNADVANRKAVEQLIKGDFYKDGKGLSERLWNSSNRAGDKIEAAIASCMAQGMGAAEMSRVLSQYAKEGHNTWSRNKIKEKLGDGYARSYGTSGLDYEALRLARTTINHQAQILQRNHHKVNPYSQKVKWHSAHQANRTCSMCIERDETVYNNKDVPLDHPNGMCHLETIFTINGQEITPEQMGADLGNWVRGEQNSGTMDKLYKDIPVSDRWMRPVITPPTQSVITVPEDEDVDRIIEVSEEYYGYLANHWTKPADLKYARAVSDVLKTYPEDMREAYLIAMENIKSMTSTTSGAFYRPSERLINLNIKKVHEQAERTGRSVYATYFHESGHAVDDILAKLVGEKFVPISANNTFIKSLKDDMGDIKKRVAMDFLKSEDYVMKAGETIESLFTQANLADLIKCEINELGDNKHKTSGIQDIIGGLGGPEYTDAMHWGHSESYWNRGIRDNEVASEAWANIMSAYCDPISLEQMNKYFPKATQVQKDLLKEYMEKYELKESIGTLSPLP